MSATVTVPVTPSKYWINALAKGQAPSEHEVGHYSTNHVIRVTVRGRVIRHGLGYVGAEGAGRQVQGGDMVRGPWAYAYGLSSVIDCNGGTGREMRENEAAGTEHTVAVGDTILIAGNEFTVGVNGYGDVTLAL